MPSARRKSAAKASSRSPSPAARRKGGKASAEQVAPVGTSIVPQMVAHDPAPEALQAMYAVLTVIGLAGLPLVPTLLGETPCEGGPDGAYQCAKGHEGKSFDAAFGVSWGEPLPLGGAGEAQGWYSIVVLLEQTTGLSLIELELAATATACTFGLLFALDLLSMLMPETISWPASWQCNNRQCYTEMFAEPTRSSLIRRPGNVYSNCIYWFAGM